MFCLDLFGIITLWLLKIMSTTTTMLDKPNRWLTLIILW